MEQFNIHAKNLKQNLNLLEAISTLTELAILGDKTNQDIFDHFIEEKIIEEFVRVLRNTKDFNIVNTIINSICMLITNIEKNIVVILSLPQLNEFIIYDYYLSNDETLDYYINLIKILSNKLTTKNIALFFNQKYAQFPLLLYSQNFYNSKENLPKTYARHILLKILQNTESQSFALNLRKYLTSYPFTQILANYINFMKDLLEKWSLQTQYYEEERKNFFYFLKDLYSNAEYLINILDNLILQIIILPQFQNLSSKDEKVISISLSILQIFFNTEFQFSSRLTEIILILCFSVEIPKIELFQIPQFIPTKDPQLLNICTLFFDKKSKEEDKQKGFLQSIQNLQNPIQFLFQAQESQKFQLFHKFHQEDGITKIIQNYFFRENDLAQLEFIQNYISDEHYYQVLHLVYSLIENQKLNLINQEQRANIIINMAKLMIDKNQNNIIQIKNSIKQAQIIKYILQEEDQQVYVTFTKCYLLKEIELDISNSTIQYYRYFRKVLQLLEEDKYDIIEQLPDAQQIVRFLLLLNINFQKQWLVNQFKDFHHPIEYEDKVFDNGKIHIKNLNIILENIELNIEDWYIQRENNKIFLQNLISKAKLEIILQNEEEQNQFMKQIEIRQENIEQHVISQIIKSLHKFYY